VYIQHTFLIYLSKNQWSVIFGNFLYLSLVVVLAKEIFLRVQAILVAITRIGLALGAFHRNSSRRGCHCGPQFPSSLILLLSSHITRTCSHNWLWLVTTCNTFTQEVLQYVVQKRFKFLLCFAYYSATKQESSRCKLYIICMHSCHQTI